MQPATIQLHKRRSLGARILGHWELYLFLVPALIYILVFRYIPIYGVQIAFRDYIATKGFFASPWVGLIHFQRFFQSYQFVRVFRNTLLLSLYQLAATFPAPIIVALLLNQIQFRKYRRFVQTVIYAPNFISTVVLVGMMFVFLSQRVGLVNQIIVALGGKNVFFFGRQDWFRHLYVLSSVWQSTGWGTIIYLAVLANVNQEMYEAALMDGANKFQRMLHIDVPSILPTAIILLILSTGQIMSVGFEKAFLMQNPLNQATSDIISIYVYKVGLLQVQYSYAAAIGLFNSVINVILLLLVNGLARRYSETSLW